MRQELARRSEEMRQEMILQKRRLELILSELHKRIGDEVGPLAQVASQKDRLMDHAYFRFENQYRLSRDVIKKRQEIYVPIFSEAHAALAGADPTAPPVILDLGCGRGEFLELLKEAGLPGKGIDLNEDMIHVCQEQGLDVEQGNFFDYLHAQPDDSLGGILACQVIEHLSVEDMIEFVKLCHQKLQKGAQAVFETVNPLSIVVSATNFYMDLSHIRQVHPTAFQFLADAIGFSNTQIRFLEPFPDEAKLQLLSGQDVSSTQINDNFRRLNDILFGYQDYALICQK
jgi:O-antigen chain-terminating methyltransferase